jgi:hypothetical protein
MWFVHPCVCAIPRAATLVLHRLLLQGRSVHLQLAMLLLAGGVAPSQACSAAWRTVPLPAHERLQEPAAPKVGPLGATVCWQGHKACA